MCYCAACALLFGLADLSQVTTVEGGGGLEAEKYKLKDYDSTASVVNLLNNPEVNDKGVSGCTLKCSSGLEVRDVTLQRCSFIPLLLLLIFKHAFICRAKMGP